MLFVGISWSSGTSHGASLDGGGGSKKISCVSKLTEMAYRKRALQLWLEKTLVEQLIPGSMVQQFKENFFLGALRSVIMRNTSR